MFFLADTTSANAFQRILASIAPIAVLFMVPYTYKIGGQLFNWGAKLSSNIGGKAQKQVSGVWNKDRQEARKNAALGQYRDLKALGQEGGVRGRFARSRAGFGFGIVPDQRGERKLLTQANKTLGEHVELEAAKINPDASTTDLAAGATAAMRSGNQAKFIAHAQKLGATPAGQEALMGLKKEFAGGLDAAGNPVVGADGYPLELTGNKKQIWNKVMEPNKDFIKDYAPDLDRGSRAFDNVKREDAQKWGAETTGRYVNHMNQNKTRLDALKAKGNDLTDDERGEKIQLQDKITRANTLVQSLAATGSSTSRALGTDLARTSTMSAFMKQGGASFLTDQTKTYARQYFDENGSYKEAPPAVERDVRGQPIGQPGQPTPPPPGPPEPPYPPPPGPNEP